MPSYRTMYSILFNALTDAIDILQRAQQKTEELYIKADDPDLHLVAYDREKEEK